MKDKKHIPNQGAGALLTVILLGAIFVFTWTYYSFIPPPNLKKPNCPAGEAPMFSDQWWCVPARKP